MPGGTGPDVAPELAAVNPRTVIVYMSGYTDDVITHQGVLEPGVKLIEKPFSGATLVAAIRAALRSRATQPHREGGPTQPVDFASARYPPSDRPQSQPSRHRFVPEAARSRC